MKVKNTLAIVSIFFIFFSNTAFSQKPDILPQLIYTSLGAEIIFNYNQHSFSIDIEGKKIKPYKSIGAQNFLTVDGVILQYLTVPFQEKVDYSNLDFKKKQTFLLDYEHYEMQYIADALKVKSLDEKLRYEVLNDNLFLFWVYNMPKTDRRGYSKQCYLITASLDHILVLNCFVNANENWIKTREFLLKIGKSLKTK